MNIKLNSSQKNALKALDSNENIFLTGAAGSGKSTLIKTYLVDKDPDVFPILASTGTAAILIGGRTFHSFFGLGIMEGGIQSTIERALRNKRLVKRIKKTKSIVLDEVSMISGPTLKAAETIARKARENDSPWGGMRVIAVGDFAQLPPVNPHIRAKEWAFLDSTWTASRFKPIVLHEIMRTSDEHFLDILNEVREGITSPEVRSFLDGKVITGTFQFEGTRLLARRDAVERYNLTQLKKINEPIFQFQTIYTGKDQEIEKFKRHSPIAETIQLKKGALIMMRQNDVEGKWVNGSLGTVEKISDSSLSVKLLKGSRTLEVKRSDFTLLDAEGKPVVTANNYPIELAWAVTIHKAQGMTLDKVCIDLRNLWEPGQAYVALSRSKSAKGLFIEGWDEESICCDPEVKRFHDNILLETC